MAGLDAPSSGEVRLDGAPMSTLDEDGRAKVRADKVGFVFQSFQLLPSLTALENVMLPLELRGDADAEGSARATRSEEQTSELQSLMRNSYAVFCLKKITK